MKKYNNYWTDMHSNLHHDKIDDLPKWFKHIKDVLDFWPIAYYPYYMKETKWNLPVEDRYSDELVNVDWEKIREFTKKANENGFTMFMGYEWQGAGEDGDHNVYFLDNSQKMEYPNRLDDLIKKYKEIDAIGIPHHLAYQVGNRGKNWSTHNEKFSPFAEVYSSHGSSENDYGNVSMNRHIHMGPRTGRTSLEEGLNLGKKCGIIASGDNHVVPAIPKHGLMCALAQENTKEAIWDAFKNRRVYGVSNSRMKMDFFIDDNAMGSEIKIENKAELSFDIEGTAAIDRVEILKNNILEEMVVKSGTWEENTVNNRVRLKFKLEFGWGPDRRHYKDIASRNWTGSIDVEGKILSVEKCYNNFDQHYNQVDETKIDFDFTSHKNTASGKWMGPSAVETEGVILEIEGDRSSKVSISLDGDRTYELKISDILENSNVFALMDEVKELTKATWGNVEHYRSDPFWHNAYKFKVGKGSPEQSYKLSYKKIIEVEKQTQYRIRVHQVNGDMAWSSPIFINYN